ncbi:hypothetical protein Tco_0876155 [Tanacetum coccineum]|uniref:Uncharacterized protein n=1 Tax=Tanacetum coccineum TaxID=301880 RepID=A0ABQ5BT46_9ASTR
MMRMTETDWLNLMMQVGSNPALARELLGADVNEENFIERMTAVKERKKRALADLRYRALKGKPLKKSEVTQMMRNLVKNQWCAAHNGTITMKDVKAMNAQQLIEEYEYICRRLEKDRLVERVSSQPASVPAATTHTADDPDSAGGGSSNPAGSAFGAPVTDSTVTTPAAMDSAGSRREIGVSPFADSAAGPSPSDVSTDQLPFAVLFESTSGGINEFFLESDEEEHIGMSRVVADPDSDDEVLAEIIFRGKSISADGVVFVDKLPDDEIVDPRVKVETVTESASSPLRSRRKHLGVRSDDFLWDKPVEDFFSSESESDDDMENYIPPLPYGGFKDWEIVSCPLRNIYYHVYYQENRRRKCFTYLKELLPHVYREDLLLLRRRMNRYFRLNPDVDVGLDLWRDVNMLCQSLHSDDVEDFWRTQDEWIVSSWKLYPKSSVHVLDLTNGKTVYMFVDKFYPIRATLLERMLRHRLTVPPSYCRDVVVAGNIIQTVQDGLRQAYECIASAPIACTARQMVFSSPWLTAKKESGSPLQTALVCNSNPLIATFLNQLMVARLQKLDGIIFHVPVGMNMASQRGGIRSCPEQTDKGKDINWTGFSFDSAVHRVHAVSFDAAVLDVAATVSAACIVAAGYIVSAGICDAAGSFRLPFYCTPPAAADAVIPGPTPEDLEVGTPSVKILSKAEDFQKRKASTSGATSSHVTKRTMSALAQSSGSPGTRDSRGKGIMVDDAAAPSAGASRPRPSSGSVPSFRDVFGDAIHADFFLFYASPYYATYPEGGVARNYEFTREEWDAPYQPNFEVLTKEVFKDPAIRKTVVDQFLTPGEMVRVESLSDDQLTTNINVLHYMMMSHGEKLAGLYGLESRVSGLQRQVVGLNDKLSTFDAAFAKSKAKRKERKKKIKSLSKSLNQLNAKVACLSTTLNQATVLEAKKDEKILRLKATPLEDTCVSPPIAKESTMTPASESLELSTNVGASYVLDDVAEVTVVGLGRVSSDLTDVVVAFFAGEKGDGSLPSFAADKKATTNPFGV